MIINTSIGSSFLDYPDNDSIAVVLYLMGCNNNCFMCHNSEFCKKELYLSSPEVKNLSVSEIVKILIEEAKRNKTNKIVLSGGDPLFEDNLEGTKQLIKLLSMGNYDIMVYTGHNVQYAMYNKVSGFKYLKCGKFDFSRKVEAHKTDDYFQLASINQELYDENYELISENGRFYFKGGNNGTRISN